MAGEHNPRGSPYCYCGLWARHHRPKHIPKSWPICECGAEASRHRVKHIPTGDPCKCGLAASNHVSRGPSDIRRRNSDYSFEYVGIDGEGVGRNPHRYVLLAAATEQGRTWYKENPAGLSSIECLDFLLELPHSRLFAFSFGYDLTKILQDVDNKTLYKLFRPSLRHRRGPNRVRGPRPVKWGPYKLNFLNGKFAVQRGRRRCVIWDIYKFYQSTFVVALERWDIGDAEYIRGMKERRSSFDISELNEIRTYCFTECRYLAMLARKLLETHVKVGLKLGTYYGPGSTAGVALKRMGIKELRGEQPRAMLTPIACAFFGGRFEHSVMGPIRETVYGYDISSAYPYHLYQLPCLACGKWSYQRDAKSINSCSTALVRYAFKGSNKLQWAPFPLRDMRGNICYPYCGEGWAWLSEYQAAQRYYGKKAVQFLGAWVYHTDCDCRPFEPVARYYRDRTVLGKDAAGIVIKLAINSIYGKLAQSTGLNPAYQSWIWAGMVTAGTRAQILDLMHSTGRRSDVLAIATDGIYSRRPLKPARPIDTGTYDLDKPLGGWERKDYPDGMFFVKPGIYFPLTEDIKDVSLRGRGIGRKTLLQNRHAIIQAFKHGESQITLPAIPCVPIQRFHGVKTSIARGLKRSGRYGEWQPTNIRVAFECPNRNPDMTLRRADHVSYPYRKGLLGEDKLQALLEEASEWEQPK